MQLATDVTNPEFSGAIANGDSMLSVRFYNHKALDTWASEEKKAPVYLKEVPFVELAIPGNDRNIIQRPATGRDASRFPVQWLKFQMETGMPVEKGVNVPGWDIAEWPELNEDQRRYLSHLRFQTVEQLAGASDAQVQLIGMNGASVREKARRALVMRVDAGIKEEIAQRDSTIADLAAKIEALSARLDGGAVAAPAEDAPRGKLTLPKKD